MIPFTPKNYQPFYCEENIWQLLQEPDFQKKEGKVLLLTHPQKFFAIWHQRASKDDTQPMCWDYHVIYIAQKESPEWQVWDLDTNLPCPCPLSFYAQHSFQGIYAQYLPYIRCFEQQVYQATFSSDRRHMKTPERTFLKPPPPWPIIQNPHHSPHQLDSMLDLKDQTHPTPLTLEELLSTL